MKKSIIIFLSIVAALFTSCVTDPLVQEDGKAGTTTVTFTPDFGTYPSGPGTKAFDNTPDIRNLYLAVFNKNGKALVEYVKAEPVTPAATNEPDKYKYTVTLKLSSQPRVIHFIANAPEEIGYGSDVDAVGNLSYSFNKDTWEGDDAYWGYLNLENGICKDTDPGFGELSTALSSVTLVRNFAQIQVEEVEGAANNFQLTRFWISNFPESSTAAPYNRAQRRFETDYYRYQYASAAMTAGYQGFCPASSALVSLKGLSESRLDEIQCLPGTTAYSYERETPVSDPLCIIVGGTSDLCSTETFYKIDLRDSKGNYIPLLRNFVYNVLVGNVYKVGEPTVEAALNSVSSGAIDTDISLQGLKDLSNGKSRIAVSETEKILFDDEPFELRYSFIPDIVNDPSYIENKTLAQWVSEGYYSSEAEVLAAKKPYVSITFEPGMSGKVIDSYSISDTDDSDGYRKLSLTPVPTGDVVKTEVVTVTGYVWNSVKGGYETIQRTVNYQMRKRLDMALTITPDRVEKKVGESLTLTIGLEENLPRSLFTIDLKITTDQMTLTPVDNTLFISSEVGADGKPAFFMKKAITWEEYCETPSVMDGDGILRKHFDCQFMTNTDNFRPVDPSFGDGDRLYVMSDDFNTASVFFIAGDDTKNRFVYPHLDKEYLVAGRPANIIFGMTKLPSDGKVFVRLNGLEPAVSGELTWIEDETIGEYAGYTVYSLDVNDASSESFAVKSKTDAASGYFQLFHDEFNNSAKYEYVVQKASFSNLKFNYNNLDYVVAGKQALATFHMDYTPFDGVVTLHLKNAEPVDGTLTGTGPDTDGYTSYVIEANTNDVNFPVVISPAEGETKAYFKLTADNFNNSAVVEALIQKLNFSKLKLINVNNTGKNYVVGGKPARIAFSLDDMPSDGIITLGLTNLTPDSLDPASGKMSGISAITDNEDGTYTVTVTGTNVTLDVTPTSGQTTATYTLSDSEFNDASLSVDIQKLSFSGLKLINVNDPSRTYVIGGKPVKISFTMEDMPADGKITLDLTDSNLTLGSGMTGASDITDNGDGTYTVTVTGTSVTIDATPVVNVSNAKFKLTDDEFNDSECITIVQKLSFSGLTFNVNTGTEYLLAGDNTSTITFKVDQLPADGDVTLWIMNAAVNGHTAAGAAVDGYTPYTVTVDGSKTTTLGITVNQTGFNGLNNSVKFYLTDDEFTNSSTGSRLVKTRCIINWSNVLVKTDYPSYPKAVSKSVSVFRNAACSDSATDFGPLTTDENGYVSSPVQTVIDSDSGGSETYYFKFTDNNVDYISGGVTLAQLAAGTATSPTQVICNVQEVNYTIKSGTLKFGSKNGGTVEVRIGTSTILTTKMNITGAPNKGYNSGDYTIRCKPNTDIYFIDGRNTYGPHKIEDLKDRTSVLNIY